MTRTEEDTQYICLESSLEYSRNSCPTFCISFWAEVASYDKCGGRITGAKIPVRIVLAAVAVAVQKKEEIMSVLQVTEKWICLCSDEEFQSWRDLQRETGRMTNIYSPCEGRRRFRA